MKPLTSFLFAAISTAVSAQCPAEGAVRYQQRTYPVVAIGGQCWFAENLSAAAFSNGDALPVVDDADLWNAGWPANSPAVVRAGRPRRAPEGSTEHGWYYNGHVVVDERGICPAEWHVPTHEDWMTLEIALGCGESEAAKFGFRGGTQGAQLRAHLPEFENWTGSNAFGWNALPSGFRTSDGQDFNFGDSAYFWSSTRRSERSLYIRGLTGHRTDVYSSEKDLAEGCSIRCLRNAP